MAKRLETLLAGGALALALSAAPVHADGMTSGGQATNGGWYAGLFAGVAWPEDWDLNEVDRIATTVERAGREAKERGTALPYSRNCFVCGSERQEPGLERSFH